MGKKDDPNPLSLRLSRELKARLYELAEKLQMKPAALAQMAVEAAIKAIEQHDFKLVVPIRYVAEFKLIDVPVPNPELSALPAGDYAPAVAAEASTAGAAPPTTTRVSKPVSYRKRKRSSKGAPRKRSDRDNQRGDEQ